MAYVEPSEITHMFNVSTGRTLRFSTILLHELNDDWHEIVDGGEFTSEHIERLQFFLKMLQRVPPSRRRNA
jgi:hypothetical protein